MAATVVWACRATDALSRSTKVERVDARPTSTQRRCRGEVTTSMDFIALIARGGHPLTTPNVYCTQRLSAMKSIDVVTSPVLLDVGFRNPQGGRMGCQWQLRTHATAPGGWVAFLVCVYRETSKAYAASNHRKRAGGRQRHGGRRARRLALACTAASHRPGATQSMWAGSSPPSVWRPRRKRVRFRKCGQHSVCGQGVV